MEDEAGPAWGDSEARLIYDTDDGARLSDYAESLEDENDATLFNMPVLACFDVETGTLLGFDQIASSQAARELRPELDIRPVTEVTRAFEEDTLRQLDEIKETIQEVDHARQNPPEDETDEASLHLAEYKALVQKSLKQAAQLIRERIQIEGTNEKGSHSDTGGSIPTHSGEDDEILVSMYAEKLLHEKLENVPESGEPAHTDADYGSKPPRIADSELSKESSGASSQPESAAGAAEALQPLSAGLEVNELIGEVKSILQEIRERNVAEPKGNLTEDEEYLAIQEKFKDVTEDDEYFASTVAATVTEVQRSLAPTESDAPNTSRTGSDVAHLQDGQGKHAILISSDPLCTTAEAAATAKPMAEIEKEMVVAREESQRLAKELDRQRRLWQMRKQMQEADAEARDRALRRREEERARQEAQRLGEIRRMRLRLIQQQCREMMKVEDSQAKARQETFRRLRIAREECERRKLEEELRAEERRRQELEAKLRYEAEQKRLAEEEKAREAERKRLEEERRLKELAEAERKRQEKALRLALNRKLMQREDKLTRQRQRQMVEQRRRENAAIVFQKYWRMRLARREYAELKKAVQRQKALLMKHTQAALVIQRFIRGWLQRHGNQSKWIMQMLRKRIQAVRAKRHAAATRIQAVWRGRRVRLRMQRAKELGLSMWDEGFLEDLDPKLLDFDKFMIPDFDDMNCGETSSNHRAAKTEVEPDNEAQAILKSSLDKLHTSNPKPSPSAPLSDMTSIASAKPNASPPTSTSGLSEPRGIPAHFLPPSMHSMTTSPITSSPPPMQPLHIPMRDTTLLSSQSSLASARRQAQEELALTAQTRAKTPVGSVSSASVIETQTTILSGRRPHSSSGAVGAHGAAIQLPPLTSARQSISNSAHETGETEHHARGDQKSVGGVHRGRSVLKDTYVDSENEEDGTIMTHDVVADAAAEILGSRGQSNSTKPSSALSNEANEWGITDPRTLEALRKRKNRLVKMKRAKAEANADAVQRLEKFHRIAGLGGGSQTHHTMPMSISRPTEGKQNAVTPVHHRIDITTAWATPPQQQSQRGYTQTPTPTPDTQLRRASITSQPPTCISRPNVPRDSSVSEAHSQAQTAAISSNPSLSLDRLARQSVSAELSSNAINAYLMYGQAGSGTSSAAAPGIGGLELTGTQMWNTSNGIPASLTKFRVSKK